MATQEILCRCKFTGESGLPTDVYVNDFVIQRATDNHMASQAAADAVAVAFQSDFYEYVASGRDIVQSFMSPVINTTHGLDVAFYDISGHLDGSDAGSPIFVSNQSLGPITGVLAMPSEVAAVISYHADLTGIVEKEVNPTPPPAFIRPAARRRGRIFIGPLSTQGISDTSAGVKLSANFVSTLVASASHFLSVMNDSEDLGNWVQWSRTDATVRSVDGGFVDNAFDTQRRRGEPPSSRTIW